MRTSLFVNSEWSKEKTSPHLHSRQMQTATLPSSETWFIWGIANANAASKLLLCHALRLQKQPSSEHRASLFCQKSSGGSCSCASIRSLRWAEGCRPSAHIFPRFCGWVRQGDEKWSREVPCPTLAHCLVHLFFSAGSLSDCTFAYSLGLVTSVHSAMRSMLCWVPLTWQK